MSNFHQWFEEALPLWLQKAYTTTLERAQRAIQMDQVTWGGETSLLPLRTLQLSSRPCCCAWLTALRPPHRCLWQSRRSLVPLSNKVYGPLDELIPPTLAPHNVPVSLPSLLPGSPYDLKTLNLGHAVRIPFPSNLSEEGREGSHGATGCSSVGSSNSGWVYGGKQGARAAPSILTPSTLQSGCVMTLGYKELMMGQRAPK